MFILMQVCLTLTVIWISQANHLQNPFQQLKMSDYASCTAKFTDAEKYQILTDHFMPGISGFHAGIMGFLPTQMDKLV